MSKDPYANSPYDSAGMPLATTVANYDTVEERRLGSVKQKVDPFAEARLVVPIENMINLIDNDFEEKKLSDKITHKNIDPKKFNSAIYEGVNIPGYDLTSDTVDIEDPSVRRKLLVNEAEAKGFEEVQKLPEVEKQETVDAIEKKAVKDSGEDDFASLIEAETVKPGQPNKAEDKKK